jgi:peptide/nickel transport system substrate-binding protein
VTASRMPTLRSARAIDEYTVELTTSEPDSFLPINLTNLFMASPSHWQAKFEESGNAEEAWAGLAADPSGSGPFPVTGFTPRERLELAPFEDCWDEARIPQLDQVVLYPMPEGNARTAALLSGQVDWIEAPAPDAIPEMESRGFEIYSNPQPHVWPWQLSFVEGSPWLDIRTRHAANLCINREELQVLLGGMLGIPQGTVGPDHPWWGNPSFEIRYDPEEARRLMEEAGYSADNPMPVKVQTSASGSGQMQPIPMNEYLQQILRACHFDIELDVIEWNTLFTNWRQGADHLSANGPMQSM